MTLPGECVNDVETTCVECGEHMKIQVCRSAAGYYVGFWCDRCGPYSRESGYYPTAEAAQKALDTDNYYR
jgi:ribosomal protein L37AE/L43A